MEVILCYLKSFLFRIHFVLGLKQEGFIEEETEEENHLKKKDSWIESIKTVQKAFNLLVEKTNSNDIANELNNIMGKPEVNFNQVSTKDSQCILLN